MERGKPDLTVYTFEVPQGQQMAYPDDELWTLDYEEAREYAREKGYQLIENGYEWDESNLLEDYAPHWQVTDTWKQDPDKWLMTSEEAHDYVTGTIGSYDRYQVCGPDGDEPEPDEEG